MRGKRERRRSKGREEETERKNWIYIHCYWYERREEVRIGQGWEGGMKKEERKEEELTYRGRKGGDRRREGQ